jgi:RNA polymerase sigma-70 factor (ECF subfamily)
MPPEPSFVDLMARLRAGDEAAAAELFDRFARRLIGLARGRLDALVRQKVDPEDVVQSVFKSFFLRHAAGQWDLGGWDGLWALLTTMTLRKCGRRAGYYHAGRRDVRREVSPRPGGESAWEACAALARDPSPEEAAALGETLEELLAPLDGRDRGIVVLSLQGCDTAEVAAAVGCSRRSVQRVLQWVRRRLERKEEDSRVTAGPPAADARGGS